MPRDRRDINNEINKLYRQLGKEIFFDADIEYPFNRKQKSIMKQIRKRIDQIEKLKVEDISLTSEAVILEPEQNEDGIMIYKFCDTCGVGNNPESTHCIKCNQPL